MSEPSLRERALRCLSRRDHSRAELARKLAPYGTAGEIEAVLDRLDELSLQSDTRMAASWTRVHAARLGRVRLQSELERRGIARELIEATLASGEIASEIDRARGVWRARFPAAPADAREWARQARFLHARGFAADIVRSVLRDAPGDAESEAP